MPIILNASQEPDESKPKITTKVLVTVPEEFLGASQHELEARQGWITGMEVQPGGVVIHASLPSGCTMNWPKRLTLELKVGAESN